MKEFDVVIIGAGTAGLAARKEVSLKTESYLVVDPTTLGTVCARVGCMPSKALIETANLIYSQQKLQSINLISGSQNIDDIKVLQHVRKLRDHFVGGVLENMDAWQSTHLSRKRAKFISREILDIEGEQIKAKNIIVATGSAPFIPPEWKDVIEHIYTTDTLFDMRSLPKSMVVVGLGAIGLELAQAFTRLGVEIIAITDENSFGGLTDEEMNRYARKVFEKEFKILVTKVEAVKFDGRGFHIQSRDGLVHSEQVLIATGRKTNLSQLNLESLDLPKNNEGHYKIDSSDFRVESTNIFIVGDANHIRPVLHEASDQGRIAGYCAVHGEALNEGQHISLKITFTSPNIALVGRSSQELKKGNVKFVEGYASFENQGRATLKIENTGCLKVLGCPETGAIWGAEIFAPGGEHLAHLVAWMISCERTVTQVLELPFYHPTLEEGLRTALRDMAKQIQSFASSVTMARCRDPIAGP
jgi:dihydrolipoamide dehydrogenase